MMSFDERLAWFSLGVLVGLVISWLKDIRLGEKELKEELDEVVDLVKRTRGEKDEYGFVRYPLVADVLLIFVIIMTVWASFATSRTNEKLEHQSQEIENITECNQQYLFKTIKALNERTRYSQEASNSNVALQKELAQFIDILLFRPPKTAEERYIALQKFDGKLGEFVSVSTKQRVKTETYSYPTEEELNSCLDDIN